MMNWTNKGLTNLIGHLANELNWIPEHITLIVGSAPKIGQFLYFIFTFLADNPQTKNKCSFVAC